MIYRVTIKHPGVSGHMVSTTTLVECDEKGDLLARALEKINATRKLPPIRRENVREMFSHKVEVAQ